ncbi:MAG TPA: type I-E CRISPR-associated protein Cas7/Cse4/CasC [Anaerolineaceae bacterium]|nr:type I-E CRISPR-associated protein Cas7/Cse4/CasC [Anaerolineaceae bacterium]
MFIELHIIQNFAPSNLNRDDTNTPKDCEFGGVRRARISSQCFKRAVRHHPVFAATTGVPLSHRSNMMKAELVRRLTAGGLGEAEAAARAEEFAKWYSSKAGKMDKNKTLTLIFLSEAEFQSAFDFLREHEAAAEIKAFAEEMAKTTKNRPGAPDIALFGRMLADRPETNIDAACQVAHAISTHAVNMDMDFFTAVDDLQQKQENPETGAGMMGLGGFNSACFYRYACIDFDQLLTSLKGDTALAVRTVEAFLRASVKAVPTGKQNSSAAQNPPSFLMTVVRRDGSAWSLANAFEKPVSPNGQGLVHSSVKALDAYWGRLTSFYGGDAQPVVAVLDDDAPLTALKPACVASLEDWIKETLNLVSQG